MRKKRMTSLLLAALMLTGSGVFVNGVSVLAQGEGKTDSSAEDTCRWDLTDIFEDDEAFEQAYGEMEELIASAASYKGKLNTEDDIYEYLKLNDEISWKMKYINCYAHYKADQNLADSAAAEMVGKADALTSLLTEETAFEKEELAELPESFWEKFLEEERMKPYARSIEVDVIREKEHTLTEEETKLLVPLREAVNGSMSLYSKLVDADMEYPVVADGEGNEFAVSEEVRNYILMTSEDREFRKAVAEANYKAYGQFSNTLAQNLNNYISGVVKLAEFQHYESAREASVKENSEIYENLIRAANNNLDTLHRNIALRKKIMGTEEIYGSDMLIPLTEEIQAEFTYEEGKKLITEALSPLGEDYGSMLNRAFTERWIDVYPREGKAGGAYSGSGGKVHPYLLLNYMDDFSSVSTLAHELGHAMHQYYSAVTQESSYNSDPTSFTSEVASVTNELLLSDYMAEHAGTKEEKLYYLFAELRLLHSSFFTQVMFAEFEDAIYRTVEEGGTLTADKLGSLWTETATKYFGEDYQKLDGEQYGWARIPHFYYNYYVYQYATSVAAACTISAGITEGKEGAVENYLAFLKSGDSADGVDLLALAGVDMTSPDLADALIERENRVMDQIEELMGLEE